MKKTLIQAGDVDKYLCRKDARIYVDNAAIILTPGARDELGKRGVRIINGRCPDADGCDMHSHESSAAHHRISPAVAALGTGFGPGFEKLLFGVATILRDDYGVSDPVELRALSFKAAEIIRRGV